MRTVFVVPRLREASVVAGACCPVPAEAVLLPELEAIAGVIEAGADWQAGEVWVEHEPHVALDSLTNVLEEFGYPATEKRNNAVSVGVSTCD